MLTSDKYIILEKPTEKIFFDTTLCIINFDIYNNVDYLKKLIKSNPHTTFWVVSNNYSKEFVLTASKLGIKNIVKFPIKEELINNFFNKVQPENSNVCANLITKPLKCSKILIVDDNEMNISLLENILSDTGAKITSCLNPIEALERIKVEKYNIFLLDILMPEMSGFELAQKISEIDINKTTPIVFISAISGDENMINGYRLGAYSYIEKPFSPGIVKAQIYNILKKEEDNNFKEKEQEQFVATLTHDLKSPINAEIIALKQIINNGNYKSDEILSELLNSAKYMKHITDKILSHYKQKYDNPVLKKENFDINDLILSSIEELKYLTSDKNINIRLSTKENHCVVNADMIEIKRVMNNLLSNAIEYSYKNSNIDINVNSDSSYIYVSLADQGIGIDLSKHDKIFDEYMTLSKEHKKIGFGLGLNICKKIIDAHNGKIQIKSKLNKGTTIIFSLPK